ncbi:hypothetical protein BU23DRAFT_254194 [Bimuria novae-zelandiae CBS 107.79]|uniref:Uncharacterized protein n=1 Tax=Bimuria novae-zelandiae CBS 107.79 TaxID=1447943 RepID=A0A6A5VYL7_9PLEO|nr:hypothetical protein BU23DRAFT_254194 [Bimuria novae-zelandiae CBS 107.79]
MARVSASNPRITDQPCKHQTARCKVGVRHCIAYPRVSHSSNPILTRTVLPDLVPTRLGTVNVVDLGPIAVCVVCTGSEWATRRNTRNFDHSSDENVGYGCLSLVFSRPATRAKPGHNKRNKHNFRPGHIPRLPDRTTKRDRHHTRPSQLYSTTARYIIVLSYPNCCRVCTFPRRLGPTAIAYCCPHPPISTRPPSACRLSPLYALTTTC